MTAVCELCSEHHPLEVWRGGHFYLIDAGGEDFPCFFRVVCRRHAAEMTDLSPEELKVLTELLSEIERCIREELRPDKINLAQFGNMVPHLHWHIVARWKDDPFFPECPWGPRQREANAETSGARRRVVLSFLKALRPVLSAIDPP